MNNMKSYILVALFVLLLCTINAAMVHGDNGGNGNNNGNGNYGDGNGNNNGNGNYGDGNGNNNGNGNYGHGNGNNNGNGNYGDGNGNNNGNGNNGNGNYGHGNSGNGNNGNNNGNGNHSGYGNGEDYDVLSPSESGQERGYCKGKGSCFMKTLVCPAECPQRKPKNEKHKGCHLNCGTKCEATCKWRKAQCDGYGSVCYDPRFIGGDGIVFYFHGSKDGNFAIVSDDKLQINAHFIGTRPQGRTRDFTWVQALAIMFERHTLTIAANRVSHWDDNVEALAVRWDAETINVPYEGEAEWRTNGEERQVIVERTEDKNSVKVTVHGLVEIDIRVRPIGKQENRVHNYQLPDDDAFAHMETQFKFINLSDLVEGVLGKTYRPDYVSPVKGGVAMPTMGGEDKYQTPSLFSTVCKACRFERPSAVATI